MEISASWYFKFPRIVIAIPILLVAGLNTFYHLVMLVLMEWDLFIGNLFLWFLFGQLVAGFVGVLTVTVSWAPVILLPILWESRRIWGIGKIALFAAGLLASVVLSSFISILALQGLDSVAGLRTTLWWARLWGVAE